MKQWIVASVIVSTLAVSRGQAAPFVPTRSAQSVAFSADGHLAVTGKSGLSNAEFPPRPHPSPHKTGVIHIWEVASGRMLRRMETFGDITKVAFSPDATLVAASRLFATDDGIDLNEVRVWDVASGQTVHALDRCQAFDFSPDGQAIAVASRRHAVVYRLDDARKLVKIPALGQALSLQFTPDGKALLAVCRTDDGRYVIRQAALAASVEVRESAALEQEFYRVAQSPAGNMLATGHADGLILLWDATRLEIVGQLQMTGNRGLQHPFFSPDGRILGSGSQHDGDVVFWDLRRNQTVSRYTFERGTLRVYKIHAQDSPAVPRPESDPQRFVFAPDGRSFLSGCHGGIIRLISNGQDIRRFED